MVKRINKEKVIMEETLEYYCDICGEQMTVDYKDHITVLIKPHVKMMYKKEMCDKCYKAQRELLINTLQGLGYNLIEKNYDAG